MTNRYLKQAELYKMFVNHSQEELRLIRSRQGRDFVPKEYDFSPEALQAMYDYESKGIGEMNDSIFEQTNNGYFRGKKKMDLQVSQWREGIREGTCFKIELYEDESIPNWFLDKVLK